MGKVERQTLMPKIPLSGTIQPYALSGCLFVKGVTMPVAITIRDGARYVSRRKTGVLGEYLDEVSKVLEADEWSWAELQKGKEVAI